MNNIENYSIKQQVIIRTYSAGVFYGEVQEKSSEEVILVNARRMREWKNISDGISLSSISKHGIHPNSVIEEPINSILLQWVEIIPCTREAITTFDFQPNAKVK
mgnify:CR=1 FL=1